MFPEVPPRVEYALTEKGRALVPLIEDMRAYGLQWLSEGCEAVAVARDSARPPSHSRRAPGLSRAPRVTLQAASQSEDLTAFCRNSLGVRNLTLHGLLEAFTTEAGTRLNLAASDGEEIPFEVVETDAAPLRRIPLYCYRPLTGDFIRARLGLLVALPSYAPAAQALEGVGGLELYLRARGEALAAPCPASRASWPTRFCATSWRASSRNAASSHSTPSVFESAYEELERAIYQGRCVTEVIAPLLGIDLDPDTTELASRRGAVDRAPVRAGRRSRPNSPRRSSRRCCCVLTGGPRSPPATFGVVRPHALPSRAHRAAPVREGRLRDRPDRLLADRRRGLVADPARFERAPAAFDAVPRDSEDEMRGFCNLISRRIGAHPPGGGRGPDNSGAGEVAWALARFEMGCERIAPFEALTDYLLALRALLEPEGPASGRLAQRLSVICAAPDDRAELAERTAHAISLERAVITGLAPGSTGVDALVEELAENLRAILRDVLCGHLNADLRGVADDLLAEAAEATEAAPV